MCTTSRMVKRNNVPPFVLPCDERRTELFTGSSSTGGGNVSVERSAAIQGVETGNGAWLPQGSGRNRPMDKQLILTTVKRTRKGRSRACLIRRSAAEVTGAQGVRFGGFFSVQGVPHFRDPSGEAGRAKSNFA